MKRELPCYWIVERKDDCGWWRAFRRGNPFETRREARNYRDYLKSVSSSNKYRVVKFNRDHWTRISGLGKA